MRRSDGIDLYHIKSALLLQPLGVVNAPPPFKDVENKCMADFLVKDQSKQQLILRREEEDAAAPHTVELAYRRFLIEKEYQK